MMEWRTIDKAPKDGTPCLLFDLVYKTHIGNFAPAMVEIEPGDVRRLIPERWVCWSNRQNSNFAPTHWMPLPDPPEPGS